MRVAGAFSSAAATRRVDHRDHRVQLRDVGEAEAVLIAEGERRSDRHRLADSCRFDEQAIEPPLRCESLDLHEEVLAQRAADAPVRHLDELLFSSTERGPAHLHELSVDVDLALRRVMSAVDAGALSRALTSWAQALCKSTEGKQVAVDGKTIRGSFDASGQASLHMIHAWVCENELLLGQRATDVKSNEITAIPALLVVTLRRGSAFVNLTFASLLPITCILQSRHPRSGFINRGREFCCERRWE
jgi:hypothetical protein